MKKPENCRDQRPERYLHLCCPLKLSFLKIKQSILTKFNFKQENKFRFAYLTIRDCVTIVTLKQFNKCDTCPKRSDIPEEYNVWHRNHRNKSTELLRSDS